jgi:sarcosine oxidase gamma subunit
MSITVLQWLDGLTTQECVFPFGYPFGYPLGSPLGSPPIPGGDWQGAPGRVLHGPGGALALNFAPARWLLLAPGDHWTAPAISAGALLFDTSGKSRLLQLPASHSALRAAVDVELVLEGRECAAVVLFDTPVVIARNGVDTLLLCVPASYADSFVASIERWS